MIEARHDVMLFRDLIAPMTPEEFMSEYYDKKPLHLPGAAAKAERVFSWQAANDMIEMSTLWTDKSFGMAFNGKVIRAQDYCTNAKNREANEVMRPDPRKVAGLLGRGATMTLDYIEILNPKLHAVSNAIASAFGAQVTCSAFCSWHATRGYGSHFDTQQVIALHIAGAKTWRVYEGRFPSPAWFPGYNSSDFTSEQHTRQKGKVLMEVEMTPGDLLYIPRGQYHDALVTSDACIHLSFGGCHSTVQDFIDLLVKEFPHDPFFREALPHFDDGAAIADYLSKAGAKIQEVLARPETASELQSYLREQAFNRVSGMALPAPRALSTFRVRNIGTKILRRGNHWQLLVGDRKSELNAVEGSFAKMLIEHDLIGERKLSKTLEKMGPDANAEALVTKMIEVGLLQKVW